MEVVRFGYPWQTPFSDVMGKPKEKSNPFSHFSLKKLSDIKTSKESSVCQFVCSQSFTRHLATTPMQKNVKPSLLKATGRNHRTIQKTQRSIKRVTPYKSQLLARKQTKRKESTIHFKAIQGHKFRYGDMNRYVVTGSHH